MLSEYQVQCPECGYLKAHHYRELNSLETNLECPKCGLSRKGAPPRADEKLQRQLFGMAKHRLNRRVMFNLVSDGIQGFWLPIMYVASVGIYTHDVKLILILIGMFLMMRRNSSPMIPMIHNQLCYVTRLMQYRYMMDGDLDSVLTHESTESDLISDYEISAGAYDEAQVKMLDNRYYAFVHWLAGGLRSIGCDLETIEQETIKFRSVVDSAVAKHDKVRSSSDTAVSGL